MRKATEAFRSIGEVARLVGVATHVLRYWEGQFPALSPVKRADGRRYYRPDDVRLAAGLYQVLREDGLTLRGARKLISKDKGAALRVLGGQRLGGEWALSEGADSVPVARPDPLPTPVPVATASAAPVPQPTTSDDSDAPRGSAPLPKAPLDLSPRLSALAGRLGQADLTVPLALHGSFCDCLSDLRGQLS